MTKISIALATYNGERFLRQQLDSLARQTLPPAELVICDDGSTDSTLSIIESFSRSAPFPVVISSNATRLGFTANFLQTARKCQGDLIAFCDQDDEWLPQKLDRMLQVSRDSDALLFAHADEWIDKDGKSMGVVYPNDPPYQKYLRVNDFHGHSIVIRKTLLEMTPHSLSPGNYKAVVGDIELGHDVLMLELATAMNQVRFIPDVLVRWRIYSEAGHGWTNQLGIPPRTRSSFADWLFPPHLAQTYAESALYQRRRSALLSCTLRDLAGFKGDVAVASARLLQSMNLMEKRAGVMDVRSRFYSAQSRGGRVKIMLEGAALGQYGSPKHGGVGLHNALRDLLACAFMRKALTASRAHSSRPV